MQNLSSDDYYLIFEGNHTHLYDKLGAHFEGEAVVFRVYAPHAIRLSIVGNFNNWDTNANPMKQLQQGFWQVKIKGVHEYDIYKIAITTSNNTIILKADPFAFLSEVRPNNASMVYNLNNFPWQYHDVKTKDFKQEPINIYEVYLGSFKRVAHNEYQSYEAIALQLINYVKGMH
ncbi:MAG: GlgB N-terminal domain-containing protein, partial [Bacilli bacterium]